MMRLILSVDIGTSGLKLLLWDKNSGRVVTESRSYRTMNPFQGAAEQQPQDWYAALRDALPCLLKKAQARAEDICAIGVDSISWTPVCLDENGSVLCPAPIWMDTRAGAENEELKEIIGEEAVFALSGNPLQPYYNLPKMRWLLRHVPDLKKRLRHVLTGNGYIVYRLTGALTHDLCQAYAWGCFNMEEGTWDTSLAEKSGLDPAWLPDLCECTAIAGVVTQKAAEECGLVPGIPVVAGGLDAACGAAGAGVIAPGITHEQSGSAGGMSICDDRFRPVRGLILSRHIVPGRYLLQGGTVGGGGVMRWMTDWMSPADSDKALRGEELTALAAQVPPGSDGVLLLPYLAGERSPIWNPDAKGVYYGLSFATGRGHMARAALEGAAYALRHNIDFARDAGASVGILRAVGGASRNALWMQIKADITGESICETVCPEATGLGCAIMAAVGCGELRSFDEAAFPEAGKTYTPDPANRQTYDSGYRQYRQLYAQLQEMMKG